MLISLCIAKQCENYSHNRESLCLLIFDHNTEKRMFTKVLRARCNVVMD